MAKPEWGDIHAAAAIISANSGHTVATNHVRLIAKAGHIKTRPLNGRENEYNLVDCRKYTVRQKGKPPMTTPETEEARARSKAQYFAISYEEQRTTEMDGGSWQKIVPDWFTLAGPCRSRKQAIDAGREEIERRYPVNPITPQFERATCYKNLRVISKSQRKAFHVEPDDTQLYEGE